MKIKSVSGHSFTVKNLEKTVEFYKKLGFIIKTQNEKHATAYLNWYWIDFVVGIPNSQSTVESYLSVDDVDSTYNEMLEMGIHPESEPQIIGINRQFSFSDPEGYKLVVFKRK